MPGGCVKATHNAATLQRLLLRGCWTPAVVEPHSASAATYLLAAWNATPPMWSRCPCVISTVCWNTDCWGQRPMSSASLHLGSIKQVSCSHAAEHGRAECHCSVSAATVASALRPRRDAQHSPGRQWTRQRCRSHRGAVTAPGSLQAAPAAAAQLLVLARVLQPLKL